MNMVPLISIVGPTAVGKTSLALWLAEELLQAGVVKSVDLVSADSRQVYKGLELTTGADVPPDFSLQSIEALEFSLLPQQLTYFAKGQIRWHGVSIVSPAQEWSMGHFRQLVELVTTAWTGLNRLIIVVGGTGLYHEYATSLDPQLFIPPNEELRENLEGQSVVELQQELARRSPDKLNQLNDSDRQNPRRLVRAIEIADFKLNFEPVTPVMTTPLQPLLTVGLQANLESIEAAIQQRVKTRLELGALPEVQTILARYPDSKLPAYSATGVKDMLAYLSGSLELEKVAALWALHEFQYAKRQLTWWKKRSGVQWFDLVTDDEKRAIKALVTAVL